MNFELVDITIIGPALLAGLLVLSTHVPLGQQVLKHGVVFIDLAIAQVAGLGVIIAANMDLGIQGLPAQMVAVSAALLATVLLLWTERRFSEVQEAFIGVLFVLAATASILALAENPHGGENLKDLLVGQILWVTLDFLWPVALVYLGVLMIWFKPGEKGRLTFYIVFAFSVTASVQLVVVYLVFASLIIPALATRQIHGIPSLIAGFCLGAIAYSGGLLLSILIDYPPGAVIVWCLFISGLITGYVISKLKSTQNQIPPSVSEISDFLTICASCKKIKDETEDWIPIETYFSSKIDVQFSHGLCPDCPDDTLT